MKVIILFPDWKMSPLLIIDYPKHSYIEGQRVLICPEDLPLSEQLRNDLWSWADLYDTQMDWDNAPETIEWTQEQHDEFTHQGEALLERLRTELGDTYQVRRGEF